MFILGFIFWNLDNVLCDALTGWKIMLGWPTAFLLEGELTGAHRGLRVTYLLALQDMPGGIYSLYVLLT